ncbi:MAG: ABC transporter permease [Syntrophothermus sp.]
MNIYYLRMLKSQPLRLIITVSGISLCIVLMLFLLGIYKGVAEGSVEYIKKNNGDIWVIQKSAENILRGTSILNSFQLLTLGEDDNVQSVSPVLLVLSTLKAKGKSSTIFLCGYDLTSKLGGPPAIVEEKPINKKDEIVLDKSFALKNKINVGDEVTIMDDTLRVTGLSSGTNAFVIQYGFASIEKVHSLLGYNDVYTCFILTLSKNINPPYARKSLQKVLPGCSFYTHQEFVDNNIKEMKTGILPMLYAIAGISGIVLTAILSLILSINILEKRKDFAVMKILGCPESFLPGLVFSQAVIITLLSSAVALILYFPVTAIIENISPEITVKNDLLTSLLVVLTAVIMSLVSSFISVHRLRHIYPIEVF